MGGARCGALAGGMNPCPGGADHEHHFLPHSFFITKLGLIGTKVIFPPTNSPLFHPTPTPGASFSFYRPARFADWSQWVGRNNPDAHLPFGRKTGSGRMWRIWNYWLRGGRARFFFKTFQPPAHLTPQYPEHPQSEGQWGRQAFQPTNL